MCVAVLLCRDVVYYVDLWISTAKLFLFFTLYAFGQIFIGWGNGSATASLYGIFYNEEYSSGKFGSAYKKTFQGNAFQNTVCKIADISWWRHQMETFSALLALCAGNSPVPVNSPHKGQWRGSFMFSLIWTWTNGWVNNRNAGDLRRNRAHYDVTVMSFGPQCVNSLWQSDAMWRTCSGSTLAQVTVARWHQAIIWTNVNISPTRRSDIHLRAVSQEIPLPSVTKVSLKTFIYLIQISQGPMC